MFQLAGGSIFLQYRVLAAPQQTDSVVELMATPPGVLCPAHERKFLPSLANQFMLTTETIIEVKFLPSLANQFMLTTETLLRFDRKKTIIVAIYL